MIRLSLDQVKLCWLDELRIRAKARFTKDDDKAFRDLAIEHGTVTVRREGVAEGSRDMSLDPYAWSSPDDDETFVRFFAVRDVQVDWRPALELTGMRAAANQEFTAFAIEWVAELGMALVDKGLLTEEEAAAVRDRAVESAPNRSLSLLHVGDVDATTDDEED